MGEGARNETHAARVFPRPLVRLWITAKQLPTAGLHPHTMLTAAGESEMRLNHDLKHTVPRLHKRTLKG